MSKTSYNLAVHSVDSIWIHFRWDASKSPKLTRNSLIH